MKNCMKSGAVVSSEKSVSVTVSFTSLSGVKMSSIRIVPLVSPTSSLI